MMKKKILEVLSAVAVLVLIFSGCPQTPGGGGGGGGDDLVLSIVRADSDDSNFIFTTDKDKDSSITYKVGDGTATNATVGENGKVTIPASAGLNDTEFKNIAVTFGNTTKTIPGMLKYDTINLEEWQDSFAVMSTIIAISGITLDPSLKAAVASAYNYIKNMSEEDDEYVQVDVLDQFQATAGKTAAAARTEIINYFFANNSEYTNIINTLSETGKTNFKDCLQRIYFNHLLTDTQDTALRTLLKNHTDFDKVPSDLNISQLKVPEWAKDIISNPAEYLLAEARVRGLG
jgi:hypothetical protein